MLDKKDKLKKLLDDQESGCTTFFIAFLIAGAATIIWKTKIALFILSVAVILLSLAAIRTFSTYCKLKKLLSAERRRNEQHVNEESNEK
ncbi:MAG: hypothetical protein [Bacteriophage sp.]|nr:MAG: hypothetical protein [Bacteriophage sp.]